MTAINILQPSDSGADLTYQESRSDYNQPVTTNAMDKETDLEQLKCDSQAEFEENYLSENSWDKYWAVNGERLIWASWIKKYSDYINPAYLNDNKELCMDENSIPKKHSSDQIYINEIVHDDHSEDSIRERKFSYDSKVNPYKKSNESSQKIDKNCLDLNCSNESTLPIGRRRSCSEHDRMLSPRTLTTTDSMTNVTKITLSSYDVTSSHVTSESSPVDDYSVSSATSEDPSNDQTRITNIDDLDQTDNPVDEMDSEMYWQFLWKKHFGDQYALHFANYVECHNNQAPNDLPSINVEMIESKTEESNEIKDKITDVECENSEGNSQEIPSVIEIRNDIDNISLDEKVLKQKKKKSNKKKNPKYVESVGFLLHNLLKGETNNQEVVIAGEQTNTENNVTVDNVNVPEVESTPVDSSHNTATPFIFSRSHDDGDDDPPEDKPIILKRR